MVASLLPRGRLNRSPGTSCGRNNRATYRPESLAGETCVSAGFAPPVRDRHPAVAAERLETDLRARRVLPPLPLRGVDHPGHPLDHLGVEALGDDLGGAQIAVDVALEHRVQQGVLG